MPVLSSSLLNGHAASVNDLQYSDDGDYLYSGSDDGTIIIWDMKNRKEYLKFIRVRLYDYVTMTPGGYYSASKGAASGIHFVKGLDIYSFDSFDLIYNRPDVILEKLGRVDQALWQG